jgi:hypothetical protein
MTRPVCDATLKVVRSNIPKKVFFTFKLLYAKTTAC